MSKRQPITVDGVTYSPLELKEGDFLPEGAYYKYRGEPLEPSSYVGGRCPPADTNRYYTKAKTVVLQGVEYAILGPSDGTDYGYQPGDGFAHHYSALFWQYTSADDSQRFDHSKCSQELRPVTKAAEPVKTNAEPTVTFKLTVAEAEDHLDILYKYVPVPRLHAILEQALQPHRDSKQAKELKDKIAGLQKELDQLRGDDQ